MKLTAERVVAYDDGIEVASHSRLHGVYGQYSTWPGHMPENHRNMKSPWNRERFESWAEAIGPETRVMVTRLLDSAPVVEQAYVPCNNILNLPRGNTGPNCLNRPPGKSTKRIVPRP